MSICSICGKDCDRWHVSHYCRSCGKRYCHTCASTRLELLQYNSVDYPWLTTYKCDDCGNEVAAMSECRYLHSSSNGDGYMPLADDDYETQQALRQQYYENVEKWNEELRRQYR